MRVSMKWEPQDLWIGAYWGRGTGSELFAIMTDGQPYMVDAPTLDVWVCIVPMLPIKFHFGPEEGRAR